MHHIPFYYDVLEQFNIELFQVTTLKNSFTIIVLWLICNFLVCELFVSLYLVIFFVSLLAYIFNTVSFLLFLVFLILLLLMEIVAPVINVGVFIVAVLSDSILKKTQSYLGGKLKMYYVFLVGTAIILGSLNLIGIIPYAKALTGHFVFVFFFSMVFFIANMIYGVLYHKIYFVNIFLPFNIPFPIIPGLTIIEVISFFSRVLSLAIRLFANLVAGHILLKIIFSFLWILMGIHLSIGFPVFFLLLGVFIIIALEAFISILQVYIWNILSIIYINNVLELH